MDEHRAPPDRRSEEVPTGGPASARAGRPASTSMPSAVADTMRRVHAALRAGQPPSYEALLAFGTPEPSAPR